MKSPFTVLAPMEGVTDVVFRQIITEIGKPDVLFTEFTSCDGLVSKGKARVAEHLRFFTNEQPIVAQIWGVNPENFYHSAKYAASLGFSGIDINMGCPDRSIMTDGACAALINQPAIAKEIIHATKRGAQGLPVSVKTRIGLREEQIEEWIGFLLKQDIAALSIHLRTVKELSKVPARWELMANVLSLRKKLVKETVIIGNGDILSLAEVTEKFSKYECEGYMIGTGIFTNPWLFNTSVKLADVTVDARLDLYTRHIKLFNETWGDSKNPALLKKFCKTYIQNFPDAVALREKIMGTKTIPELLRVISSYRESLT